jgi:hypothetical protein
MSNTDKKDKEEKAPTNKTEPETLHTTDPQEEMEGPVSSLIQGMKHKADHNNETKEEADEKKDENM